MSDCSSCTGDGSAGPLSEGRELVQFVCKVHNGQLIYSPIAGGSLKAKCQGCGTDFEMMNHVFVCPNCNGVHAVSPPRANDANNIQFAGKDVTMSELL